MPVIGFLDAGSAAERADFTAAFRQGLADAGYVEGQQNVAIEYAGRKADTIACRSWRTISFAVA
jgi:hypothetical protein